MKTKATLIPQEIEINRNACPDVELTLFRLRPGHLLGRCPFHKERTGSFTVDLETGSFHCFGCGRMGQAFIVIQTGLYGRNLQTDHNT